MICTNQLRPFSLLTRLSTIAGERLKLHNPGIADLSDENRPNKLAENSVSFMTISGLKPWNR